MKYYYIKQYDDEGERELYGEVLFKSKEDAISYLKKDYENIFFENGYYKVHEYLYFEIKEPKIYNINEDK